MTWSKNLQNEIEANLQGEACTLIRIGEHSELVIGFGNKTTKLLKRSRDGKIISVERTPWEFRIPRKHWTIKDQNGNGKILIAKNEISKQEKLTELLSSKFKSISYINKIELRIILKNNNAICAQSNTENEPILDLFRPENRSTINYICNMGWREENI